MKVAIDGTALLGRRTGVGEFTAALVDRLAEVGDVELLLFALTWRGRGALTGEAPPGIEVSDRPLPARPLREAWLRFDRPRLDQLIGPHDLVHGPNFVVPPSRAVQVVTVHDLTAIRYPAMCTPDVLQFPDLIRRAIRRGAWVHTVSDFVRAEVIAHFPVAPDRVVTVPNGFTPMTRGNAWNGERIAGGERYVLALGTVEPRKDLPLLVRAFDAIASDHPELRLVLAGQDGWGAESLHRAINAATHRSRVVRLGYVSDEQRADLMVGASVFAYPSVYEGFGLPPLEAMSAGTPVVSTDAGGLLEVVGDGALRVKVGDVDGFASALDRVLTEPDRAEALVAAGHRVSSAYTWDRMATGVLDLYRRAVAHGSRA